MDKIKKMLKRSKWAVPVLLGVLIVLLLVGIIYGGKKVYTIVTGEKKEEVVKGSGSIIYDDSQRLAVNDGSGSVNGSGDTDNGKVTGKNGVRYQIDGAEDAEAQREAYASEYNSRQIQSSGYGTNSKNTGTSSRLAALQEELEAIRKNQKKADNTQLTNDMRSKVDYDDMSSAIKTETDTLKNQMDSQSATAASEHATLRTTIANNKADVDTKISALEAKIGTVKSDTETVQRNVTNNQTTSDKNLNNYKEQMSKTTTEINNKIGSLEASTNKKISELSASTGTEVTKLKEEIQKTINYNITNINTTISGVEQVMLVGTYKNGVLTVKKGYDNK